MPTDTSSPGRLRYAASLLRLAAWLIAHPSAPLPGTHLGIPVPAGPRGARLARLDQVVAAYGTPVTRRYGMLITERQFGPLWLEAHVRDREDYTQNFPALLTDGEIAAVTSWASGTIPERAA